MLKILKPSSGDSLDAMLRNTSSSPTSPPPIFFCSPAIRDWLHFWRGAFCFQQLINADIKVMVSFNTEVNSCACRVSGDVLMKEKINIQRNIFVLFILIAITWNWPFSKWAASGYSFVGMSGGDGGGSRWITDWRHTTGIKEKKRKVKANEQNKEMKIKK